MTKLKADLTKTPTLDSKNPGKSAAEAGKWTGAVAVAIFLFGVAGLVAGMIRSKFAQATGVSTDGTGLSGPWEDI